MKRVFKKIEELEPDDDQGTSTNRFFYLARVMDIFINPLQRGGNLFNL